MAASLKVDFKKIYNERTNSIKIDLCLIMMYIISQTYFEWVSINEFPRDLLSLQNCNTSRKFITLVNSILG